MHKCDLQIAAQNAHRGNPHMHNKRVFPVKDAYTEFLKELNFNNSGQKGNSGIDLISVILLDMFPWLMRDKTIFKRLVHA